MKGVIKWLVLLALLFPLSLHANDMRSFDMEAFAQIPILHEGRIKPLDSFARVMLKHISGASSLPDATATQWLAEVLFTPSNAMGRKIFAVRSAELRRILSLPLQPEDKYSFSDLATVFGIHQEALAALATKDKKNFTATEQELVNLYNSFNDYADIMATFSLLMPLPDVTHEIKHALGFSDNAPVTYLETLKIGKFIQTQAADITERKKDPTGTYTPDELHTVRLGAHLMLMEALDKNNALVRVIPPMWEGSEEWLSPWAVITRAAGSPQSAELFHDWQGLLMAYQQNDPAAWKKISHTLLTLGAKGHSVRPDMLMLEVAYNDFNFLHKSLIAYGAGFLLALISLLRRTPRSLNVAYFVLLTSAVMHVLAIAARMAILMRPPVSTLYESMIFVSFIAMFFGLWMTRGKKEADGLVISSAIAGLLLLAANVFAADNDTLEVLVAVLNTNFWLGTHVVCITTGYGASLVAGTLAHLYLFKCAFSTATKESLALLQRRIHTVGLVALLFTAVGTMLGGIWADQSWGRFWGWDPKENGALWIVLWLIWLLHARIAGQFRQLAFAVGMALINIVVALAWVGVNLLSVGLHSYGFTDTAANSLLTFCACELGYVGVTTAVIRWRKKTA